MAKPIKRFRDACLVHFDKTKRPVAYFTTDDKGNGGRSSSVYEASFNADGGLKRFVTNNTIYVQVKENPLN